VRFRYFYFLIVAGFSYLFNPYSYSENEWKKWEDVLEKLPGWDGSQYYVEEVSGGLTNKNYKLSFRDFAYFLREGSGDATVLGLSSQRDYENTRFAAALGIAPSIILYHPEYRLMASSFIPSIPFKWNDSNCSKVIQQLKQFHQSKILLPARFDPFKIIEDYGSKAKERGHYWDELFWEPLLQKIQEVLPASPLCPCHLDLHQFNFLDDGDKIWIVDWEYAGMATVLFDLSTWVSGDYLSEDEMWLLLHCYYSNPSFSNFAELYLNAILCDIRWGLWSLIQKSISPVAFDYQAYADAFFSHAKEKASAPLFNTCLERLTRMLEVKAQATNGQ